jgi:hypothetical protein
MNPRPLSLGVELILLNDSIPMSWQIFKIITLEP